MIFPSFNIKIERWKYNPVFELYVSTSGRVKNKSKIIVPPKIKPSGYLCVRSAATGKYISLHRLVMLTWQPRSDAEFLTVDHINHNKRDNSLANLEWVTEEENQYRAKRDCILNGTSNRSLETFILITRGAPKDIFNAQAMSSSDIKNYCDKKGIDYAAILKVIDDFDSGKNTKGQKTKFGLTFTTVAKGDKK